LAEELEPTIPLTDEQIKWAEEHKQDPKASIEQQASAAGLQIKGTDIPVPSDPVAYMEQQLEVADMVGAKVTRGAPGFAHSWLDMPREHVCRCSICDKNVRVSAERSSEHHYSAAFGDAVMQVVKIHPHDDGKPRFEWVNDAVEVDVDGDYAIRVSQPVHECGNCLRRKGGGGNVCTYRDHGEFGVRLEVNAHNS
jgi:hypothetical protein